MNKFSFFILFIVVYGVVSFATFMVLFFIAPGFPYFPSDVYSTTEERVETELKKGDYVISYYVKGKQGFDALIKDVGMPEIDVLTSHGEAPVKLIPSHYYFDEAPGDYGIRGLTVCRFEIPTDQRVAIKSNFKKYDYDGLIVKTRITKLIVSFSLFELFAFTLSCMLTWFLSASLLNQWRKGVSQS
jgi:hypothetical protein